MPNAAAMLNYRSNYNSLQSYRTTYRSVHVFLLILVVSINAFQINKFSTIYLALYWKSRCSISWIGTKPRWTTVQ